MEDQNSPDSTTVILKFAPESMQDLQKLARNLGSSIPKVIGQALALLKAAQGRTIILKDPNQAVEIKNYETLPPQAKFEIK